jgi:hypothetical protein
MFIPDPGSGFFPSRIPDLGVKKAPDPDSQNCIPVNMAVILGSGFVRYKKIEVF